MCVLAFCAIEFRTSARCVDCNGTTTWRYGKSTCGGAKGSRGSVDGRKGVDDIFLVSLLLRASVVADS